MDDMHRLAAVVVGLCWVVFAGRWLLGLPGAGRARRTAMDGGGAAWTAGNAVAFALLARYGYRVPVLRTATTVSGAGLAVAGVVTTLFARRELSRNWSKDAALVEDQELVTSGPYRWVRHPIYSGYLALLLGSALLFETVGLFALTAFQAAFLTVKAQREETLLAEAFPGQYTAYRSAAGRLIPRLRRIRRSAGSSSHR